jgi:hypothetical protein
MYRPWLGVFICTWGKRFFSCSIWTRYGWWLPQYPHGVSSTAGWGCILQLLAPQGARGSGVTETDSRPARPTDAASRSRASGPPCSDPTPDTALSYAVSSSSHLPGSGCYKCLLKISSPECAKCMLRCLNMPRMKRAGVTGLSPEKQTTVRGQLNAR